MDPYSSGEDLVVKTRKPYTITKQRERWTEEEHNRFLEALKLYGRAWQRIEEYIGTKTAVQIRSHAQKFFTKLEKEAVVKGIPVGHALDIEIPPPRPKRKPSNPYPRKTNVAALTVQVAVKDGKISNLDPSPNQDKITLNSEKEPQKHFADGKLGHKEAYTEKGDCSEVLLSKRAPCAFSLSANKSSLSTGKSCISEEELPFSKEARNKEDETTGSYVTTEDKGLRGDVIPNKLLGQENRLIHASNVIKSVYVEGQVTELKQSENIEILPASDVQTSQNYPRHVPVHILNQNLGMASQNVTRDTTTFAEPLIDHVGPKKQFTNAAASASSEQHTTACSSFHPLFPCYHPIFTPIQNQDDYRSFLHISSTFSSLIVSALLQNPAAHAAASFAATLWPYVNVEAAVEHPVASPEAFQSRPINSAPSAAAIAAATVAAATAWWAAHGLLPLCAPFHPGFTCPPASASTTPTDSQTKALNNERRESNPDADLGPGQQLEPECSEALQEQRSTLKSPTVSSSDSEGSQGDKGLAAAETTQLTDGDELHGANKSKNRKQVDRSSCGSNTPSSSEVEADALDKHTKEDDEKHMKDKEESKELDAVHYASDPFGRRCRSTCGVNDPWKEVSEEGRMAFEALFSREVLPQSFSPPHDLKNEGKNTNADKLNSEVKDEDVLQFDLNRKTCENCSPKEGLEQNTSFIGLGNEGEPLNMGLGHAKLKARRTGFKPYKRCSVEAKDSRVSANCQDEEKGPKRLRLEREASN